MIQIVSMLAMHLIQLVVLLCIAPNLTGKTTCMAMLTAEFPPSSGDAILDGFSVSNEPDQTRRTIGYCPQFDAHFANMTGAEHVELYAVIKGVRRDLLKEVVSAKLNEVGLSEFDGNRLSSTYSGGESYFYNGPRQK